MILLKKQLDEVLKMYNLPDLFIKKINGTTAGQLCTPCGKPIAYLNGIIISGSKLNIEEREYVFEAVSKYIMENAEKLHTAVNAIMNPIEHKKYDGYKISAYETNDYQSEDNRRYVEHSRVSVDYGYSSNKSFQLTYTPKSITISCSGLSMDELQNQLLNNYDDLVKMGKEAFKTQEKILAMNQELKELTQCSW